jgi:hypothetical protein
MAGTSSLHEECGGTFGPTERVGGHGAQVGAERAEVDRDVTRGGARVDVDQRVALRFDADHDGRGRLERAHLVVGELDRHQHRVGADRSGDRVDVDATMLVDAHDGGVGRAAYHRVEHGGVLHRRRDDVSASPPCQRAPHRGVHGLGPGGGEHHLARARAESRRDLLASILDRDARPVSLAVQPPGVAVVVAEIGEHRLERDRSQRRRRCVVEVGARHTRATQCSPPSGRLVSNWGDVSP